MSDKPQNINNGEPKTATELNLDVNNSFVGITSPNVPSTKLKYSFENGDDVILKKGDIRIRVTNSKNQPDGSINGEVKTVDPSRESASLGIDESMVIKFNDKHIFGCMKK